MNNFKKLTTGAITAVAGVLASTGMVFAGDTKAATSPIGNISIEVPAAYSSDVGDIFNKVLGFVLVIAGILVFAYLIWGGVEWITSGGDSGKTEKARNKITGAIVGLVILVSAYAIFKLVLELLGLSVGDMFNVTKL